MENENNQQMNVPYEWIMALVAEIYLPIMNTTQFSTGKCKF